MLVSIYNAEDTERVRARRLSIAEPRITIGRAATCTIVVDDDVRVIEHHLEIEVHANAFVVTPRGTTSVNGAVITVPTTCALGDTVQLGNTIVKLRAEQRVVKTLRRERVTVPSPAMNPVPETPSRGEEITPVLPYPVQAPPMRSTFNPPVPLRYGPNLPTKLVAPPKVFRDRLAPDDAEHELLARLRAKPDDPDLRLVYADWLEDHGFVVRAQITRGAHADVSAILAESTPEWRAIASCATVYDCMRDDCPRQWSRFAPALDDERLRACGTCSRTVRYCLHALDPRGATVRGEVMVIDTSLEVENEADAGDTLDDPPPGRRP